MLNVPSSTRIYVCAEPVDIRKGFDALAGWVEANGLDVYSGHVFVFLSRRMTHLKALTWSRGGFVILFKRLEAGHFKFPARAPGARAVAIDATDLAMMLDGIDIQKVRKPKGWSPASRGIDAAV
ncbi:MAG: IS66 family insertion sequence element accessory protein TnpB [Deltaproteobacteria bacterium]|nr:IS66 family insertion sequence element accessory protein TnpB [Deltaproteobacteria bacterium]MBM4398375.1 IS66 family insertion sequence element accessory protein TnpB [Deltaproteobacteria bacterium]